MNLSQGVIRSTELKTYLRTMLEMQDQMNTKVHPQWRDQNFAWSRAAWIECAEMLDHYGWKWWKKQEPDMEQVKLELVDIWHFHMSWDLQYCSIDELVDSYAEDLMEDITFCASDTFPQCVDRYVRRLLVGGPLFRFFMDMLGIINMPFTELYTMYVGKNVLNNFRQDNGYKTGDYIKIWDGREDNEHLAEIIATMDPTDPDLADKLLHELEVAYRSFIFKEAVENSYD